MRPSSRPPGPVRAAGATRGPDGAGHNGPAAGRRRCLASLSRPAPATSETLGPRRPIPAPSKELSVTHTRATQAALPAPRRVVRWRYRTAVQAARVLSRAAGAAASDWPDPAPGPRAIDAG